jgi:hypothetical protein
MERFRKSRLALLLIRILLIAVLFADAGLVTMIFQHLYSGGIEGVKAWIVHTHATFETHRWEMPVEQLARDSYKQFASAVGFLVVVTATLLFGERRVSRLSKLPGGSSTATTH